MHISQLENSKLFFSLSPDATLVLHMCSKSLRFTAHVENETSRSDFNVRVFLLCDCIRLFGGSF